MLGFLFGFNARIGRLQYFLGSVGLAIFMTIVIFAIAFSAVHGSPGPHGSAREIMLSQLKWPLIAVGGIFLLMSFMLQSMRFRDIGWDPVCVIPGWIALVVIDRLIATKFPALSIGHEHHGTIVGVVVNFGLVMALVFWPGGGGEDSPPAFRTLDVPVAPLRRQDGASARIARITDGQFGRRTF
jgi:uncharacterized membrane protein YhaH (DUF805 family)